MSGRPNPTGIAKLRESLQQFEWTREQITELQRSIHRQEKELELRTTELRGLSAMIDGLLASC